MPRKKKATKVKSEVKKVVRETEDAKDPQEPSAAELEEAQLEDEYEKVGSLPEKDHYHLLFVESKVHAAQNKLNEQNALFQVLQMEQQRKTERAKAQVRNFSAALRDCQVEYQSYLAKLAHEYGIDWKTMAVEQDGTIVKLPADLTGKGEEQKNQAGDPA